MRAVLVLLAACELPHGSPAQAPCDLETSCPAGQVCLDHRCMPEPSTCAEAVTAGDAHTCAIRDDHTAWCWGRNEAGQLGDGTDEDRTEPVQVVGAMRFTAIAAGFDHTCAVGEDHTVWCWGSNEEGQLGETVSSLAPVRVSGLADASAIAVGRDHSCALLGTGGVKCWGKNDTGQLGNGTDVPSRVPTTVHMLNAVKELVSGVDTTCTVDAGGLLMCWGANAGFQLGDEAHHRTPSRVAIPDAVAHVAVGLDFLCALTVGGAVYCAGRNQYGQLGIDIHDPNAPHETPGQVPLTVRASAITAGAHFACATELRDDRHDRPRVWCWGQDDDGELADRAGLDRSTPALSDHADVAATAAGSQHLCALSSAGGIACNGYNGTGQLGDGERTTQGVPPPAIAGLSGVGAIATGAAHTCAVVADGVECWGDNRFGQLGDGTLAARSRPVRVVGVGSAIAVAAGEVHSCALLADHTAMCWGGNETGQIGDAMRAGPIAPPSRVVHDDGSPLTDIAQIAAAGEHTCAIAGAGAVWCWGSNHQRQVGADPSTCFNCGTPVAVPLPPGVVELALGGNHSCALNADRTLMCWGASDNGERGDGTIDTTPTPTPVGAPQVLMNVDRVAAFGDFACAIQRGGTATCWGGGRNGEMGDGTYSGRRAPEAAVKASGVTVLATGSEHACALASGGLTCWGASYHGQAGPAGRGGYVNSALPAVVPLAGSPAMDLAAGDSPPCALLADHTVTCWGDGRSGQLGDGMLDRRARVAPRLPCP
jgi:alpha-tubulin suppressor-like RCC1 family protein